MRTRNKFLIAAAGVAAVGTASIAGVALAADPTENVNAPYAQAAAYVKADGTAARKTNAVGSVTKTATGRYCVTLTSNVDANKVIPNVSLTTGAPWHSEIYVVVGGSSCPQNSLRVQTGVNGSYKDLSFYVVAP
ncbi:hypothetical protein [Streptomyces sp. NPDC057682]|uniref:hypothetical protein n=1 Tax=Streptomyces sp. NPDC057682 TaxID=3346210 RepID=UPI0036AEC194